MQIPKTVFSMPMKNEHAFIVMQSLENLGVET
jgi:hypothetical protein